MSNVLSQASSAQTASGSTAFLNVSSFRELAVDINVTAVSGTVPSCTFKVDRLGADGIWYNVWTSAAITAAGTASTSVGPGLATSASFGDVVRLTWTISGTTPSFTFSASIVGD